MKLKINKQFIAHNSQLSITGSKSETNRLLLLRALYQNITLENISNSDDSDVMLKVLEDFENPKPKIQNPKPNFPLFDIHHAGTAMRFLTAYFAQKEGAEIVLTGSSRMQERPIALLVDALKQLGADIEYVNTIGFPPLKIKGKKITKNKVSLTANVSSQYISALLLIAPKLENGLQLTLEGEITSIPYIKMTLALLEEIGVDTTFENNSISVGSKSTIQNPHSITIESDWSSASYFYSMVALSEIGTQITLSSYKQNSLQGDSALVEIYKKFGVDTVFNNDNTITFCKINFQNPKPKTQNPSDKFQIPDFKTQNPEPITQSLEFNLQSSPDIAQTIAVTCFGLGISCHLTGLHTLKIKETDRLEALKIELSKLGAAISVTNDTLTLQASSTINPDVEIETYQDHRMAMAFAPLALKTAITINDAEVVSKSFPTFWDDLKTIGFSISEA